MTGVILNGGFQESPGDSLSSFCGIRKQRPMELARPREEEACEKN